MAVLVYAHTPEYQEIPSDAAATILSKQRWQINFLLESGVGECSLQVKM